MAESIDVPPGDPGQIRLATSWMRQLAGDLDTQADILSGEKAGITGAWPDKNGKAAAATTGAVATKGHEYATHMGTAMQALNTYATALESAQETITSLQAQKQQAMHQASAETNRRMPTAGAADKADVVEGVLADLMTPILAKYHQAQSDLHAAATTCHNTLLAAVPDYHKGMTVEDIGHVTIADFASTMPVAVQETQAYARDLAGQTDQAIQKQAPLPDALVRQLDELKNNPYFASTFLDTLGAKDVYSLVHEMESNTGGYDNPVTNRRILGDFGTMIAVGTADNSPVHVSGQFVNDLLSPLDHHDATGVNAALALSQITTAAGNVPYGTSFLAQVGDKLYGLERSHGANTWVGNNNTSVIGDNLPGQDPMQWYFGALSHNPGAAQQFFGHSDRVDYYLTGSRPYFDKGKALGGALEAATLHYRDGAAGDVSTSIAQRVVSDIGSHHNTDWLAQRSGLRGSVGNILAGYANAIDNTFADNPQGPAFDRTALQYTMAGAFTDDTIRNHVIQATVDDQSRLMHDAVFGSKNMGDAWPRFNEVSTTSGRVLGAIWASDEAEAVQHGHVRDSGNAFLGQAANELLDDTFGKIPIAGDIVTKSWNWAAAPAALPTDHELKAVESQLHDADGQASKESVIQVIPRDAYDRLLALDGGDAKKLDQQIGSFQGSYGDSFLAQAKTLLPDDS